MQGLLEEMMAKSKNRGVTVAYLFAVAVLLIAGCAGGGMTLYETGGQTLQQEVTTEYLLTTAGFQRWDVNQETPKRAALLSSLPPGQISTYIRDGEVLHAYPGAGQYVLVGSEAAYQKYLSLARGRQLCRQATGANQEKFWVCMEEYQQGGGQPRK